MSLNVRLAEIIATRLWCFVDVGTQLQKHLHALDLPENSLVKLPFFSAALLFLFPDSAQRFFGKTHLFLTA